MGKVGYILGQLYQCQTTFKQAGQVCSWTKRSMTASWDASQGYWPYLKKSFLFTEVF